MSRRRAARLRFSDLRLTLPPAFPGFGVDGGWTRRHDALVAAAVRTFEVLASRESPWWLLTVPELGIVTQARYWGEAELMARELIAVHLDVDLESVAVELERSSGPAGP